MVHAPCSFKSAAYKIRDSNSKRVKSNELISGPMSDELRAGNDDEGFTVNGDNNEFTNNTANGNDDEGFNIIVTLFPFCFLGT